MPLLQPFCYICTGSSTRTKTIQMIKKILHLRFFLLLSLFASISVISCTQLESSPRKRSNLKSMTNLKTDTATFGAGCFWCVEAVFQQLDGVLKVTSGYSGGNIPNPTYE